MQHTRQRLILGRLVLGLLLGWGGSVQALTLTQLQALKAHIEADGTLNAQPNTGDGNFAIAAAMNAAASPDFWVYRTNISIQEVGGAFHGPDLAGLTTANNERLQTIALYNAHVDASIANRRAFFDDVFSGAGGTTTRANLAVLWRRLATRAEKLYATGTGSIASPATMTFEGPVNYQDIESARNLP